MNAQQFLFLLEQKINLKYTHGLKPLSVICDR